MRLRALPPWAFPAFLSLAALAIATGLGTLAAAAPRSLAPERLLSLPALAGAAAAIVGTLALLRSPTAAIVILAGGIYLNLSQALVRHHGLPSLLQLLAVPLVVAAWARRGDLARRRALAHPVGLALLAYGLLLVASTAWADDVALADGRVREHGRMLVVYALAASLAAGRVQLRAALRTIVVAGAFLSLLALVQAATGDWGNDFGGLARVKRAQVYDDVFEPRVAGPLGDPNFFAQLLVPLVPVALFAGWEERSRRLRLLAFALAALIVAGTVLTYSRGAALALAVVVALTLASHRTRLRKLSLVALVAVAATVAWVPTDFTRRLTTIAQLVPGEDAPLRLDSSIEERRLLARTAWAIFTDHPALGVGTGNYTTHYERYANEVGSEARIYDDPGIPRYPHNLYLEIGAETGLVGLALFGAAVALCLASLQRAHRAAARVDDAWLAGMARALQVGIVGHLVAGLFLHGAFQRHVWLLFGLAAAVSALAAQPREDAA
jgi:putative inorganic carbon (HCO3(-)) transporter